MLGLIGGTGLNRLAELRIVETRTLTTRYGAPSAPLQIGELGARPVAFLPRHGDGHHLPPHAINYRANLQALHSLGVTHVLGVAAVGGINPAMPPGDVVLPDDLIDYTWGREHSYSYQAGDDLQHLEFAPPYHAGLRAALMASAVAQGISMLDRAVHGITQGPRLETAAEIRRLRQDGCDLVGMTGMPEAALAAELGLPYACLAVVVNWAAGIGSAAIHAEIEQHIESGMGKARRLIQGLRWPA